MSASVAQWAVWVIWWLLTLAEWPTLLLSRCTVCLSAMMGAVKVEEAGSINCYMLPLARLQALLD